MKKLSPSRLTDERFMRVCLRQARRVVGLTTPNPAVGCLIVRRGRIIAEGVTERGGRPHAEAVALQRAGNAARGATAYVSFEPCAHQGQTPPCARALAQAGVARVVVGCLDPYPPVRGRGVAALRAAGVEVCLGVLAQECRRLNEGFLSRVLRGRPFVTLKLAMSADGRIATASGDSRWISSAPARRLVHRMRREHDAVMVGAGTVAKDNPRLTCRIAGGRDPVRVIIDERVALAPWSRIFRLRSDAGAILVTTRRRLSAARKRYGSPMVEVIGLPSVNGRVALSDLMRQLAGRGWCKVLIEGGAHLAARALSEEIVDRVCLFVAPILLGCGLSAVEGLEVLRVKAALRLANFRARRVGSDWLLEGEPVYRARSRPKLTAH